jgi:hypothetical protein
MQKLSIQDLDQIPLIPLTAELARRGITLSDELATKRTIAALHEAAHLVAAMATSSPYISSVVVHPKAKGPRGVTGTCFTAEVTAIEESFVSMAGYAWEERHGDAFHADSDYARGCHECPTNYLDALHAARGFIVEHDTVIRHAAVGILSLCTVQGLLDGDRLKALRRWLKPNIKPFRCEHAE